MRQIIKGSRQPDSFKEWKRAFRKYTKRSATYSDLQNNRTTFLEFKDILKKEQYYLCCYCCNALDENDCHIEHFVPQSVDGSLQLDYRNMFISCNGYVEDISTIDRESCGHRRENWYDSSLVISPTDAECEKVFIFLPDGEILPEANNNKARAMIEHLGLGSYALTKAREAAIDVALESIGFSEGSYDVQAIKEELEFNQNPDTGGKLPPFCDAVSYILERL